MTNRKKEFITFVEERFGISPDAIREFAYIPGDQERLLIGPQPPIEFPRTVVRGLLIARTGRSIKPTSIFAQLFGALATRNSLTLSREQAKAYLEGNDIQVQETHQATDGVVILFYEGVALGMGLLQKSAIKNMLQKAKRQEILFL